MYSSKYNINAHSVKWPVGIQILLFDRLIVHEMIMSRDILLVGARPET